MIKIRVSLCMAAFFLGLNSFPLHATDPFFPEKEYQKSVENKMITSLAKSKKKAKNDLLENLEEYRRLTCELAEYPSQTLGFIQLARESIECADSEYFHEATYQFEAFLQKIENNQPSKKNLETLKALHKARVNAVTFALENSDQKEYILSILHAEKEDSDEVLPRVTHTSIVCEEIYNKLKQATYKTSCDLDEVCGEASTIIQQSLKAAEEFDDYHMYFTQIYCESVGLKKEKEDQKNGFFAPFKNKVKKEKNILNF